MIEDKIAIGIMLLNMIPTIGFGILINYLSPWLRDSYYFIYVGFLITLYFLLNCFVIFYYDKKAARKVMESIKI